MMMILLPVWCVPYVCEVNRAHNYYRYRAVLPQQHTAAAGPWGCGACQYKVYYAHTHAHVDGSPTHAQISQSHTWTIYMRKPKRSTHSINITAPHTGATGDWQGKTQRDTLHTVTPLFLSLSHFVHHILPKRQWCWWIVFLCGFFPFMPFLTTRG